MRIIYLGTPEFAVEPLKAIVESGKDEVVAVVCNHDKPVGRKQILTPPPVKVYAKEHNIKVYQYDKIKKEGVSDMKSLNADLMITCAFGQILSQEIIDIPKKGVINIHASLLPKYRGASPINYAILNGETKTGITVMRTDAGIDTGDVLFYEETDINNEYEKELSLRLSKLGAKCIIKALDMIRDGSATFYPQDEEKATYTKMIKKEDLKIDFNNKCDKIINQIRAFNYGYTFLNGEPFKIYSAKRAEKAYDGKIGQVLVENNKLFVKCEDGAIELTIVQKAGGKQNKTEDFLRGNKIDKVVLG